MFLGRTVSDSYVLNIDGMEITYTAEVTLLGVSIDNKLTFQNHINELCRRASYKFHALHHIRPFLSKEKARLFANALLIDSFYMLLLCGCLLIKIQLKKSAKFISEHTKLFIMSMTNRTRSYLLSVMISLYIKNTFVFWQQRSTNL